MQDLSGFPHSVYLWCIHSAIRIHEHSQFYWQDRSVLQLLVACAKGASLWCSIQVHVQAMQEKTECPALGLRQVWTVCVTVCTVEYCRSTNFRKIFIFANFVRDLNLLNKNPYESVWLVHVYADESLLYEFKILWNCRFWRFTKLKPYQNLWTYSS